MKFVITALSLLLLTAPVYGADNGDQNDPAPSEQTPDQPGPSPAVKGATAELLTLTKCMASNTFLSHLETQIAASITVLSGDPVPAQLKLLIKSYQDMAALNDKQVVRYQTVLKEAVIPQLVAAGVKEPIITAKVNELMQHMLVGTAIQLGNPNLDIDDLTVAQQAVLAITKSCESQAETIEQNHTL